MSNPSHDFSLGLCNENTIVKKPTTSGTGSSSSLRNILTQNAIHLPNIVERVFYTILPTEHALVVTRLC